QQIEHDQQRLMQGKFDWMQAGQQTLALTAHDVQTLFRPNIDELVQEVGLTKTSVQIQDASVMASASVKGAEALKSLKCVVTADGSLDKILSFFYKLHQRPYFIRCQKFTIEHSTEKNAPKGMMRMRAEIDTLLLPNEKSLVNEKKTPGVEDLLPHYEPVNLVNPPSNPTTQPARPKIAKLDDYHDIIRKKIFQRYEPPIPPPDKVAGHRPGNNGTHVFNQSLGWNASTRAKTYDVFMGDSPEALTRVQEVTAPTFQPPKPLEIGKAYYWRVDATSAEGTTTGDVVKFTAGPEPVIVVQEPPELPPADQNMILTRIISSPRGQEAVLEDPINKALDAKRVEVGEPFYEGTLVLVHPKGVVSQSERKANRGQYRFHPIAVPLKDGVPLTAETQPMLLDEILKLEARSSGISQR
ncbi:MAG: hypothetical protein FWC56_06050, partial [Phycisphaerae bacterium]|nr:hypothetical protein [Phycisphaerae bacterium]